MLPDKNELNDELIEQISGGEDDQIKTEQKVDTAQSKDGVLFHICPNCGMSYIAAKRRPDSFCPSCESKHLEISIPTGDFKTTIPNIPKKKNNNN